MQIMKTRWWVVLVSSLFVLAFSTVSVGCNDKDVPRDPEDLDEQLLIMENDAGVTDDDDTGDEDPDDD